MREGLVAMLRPEGKQRQGLRGTGPRLKTGKKFCVAGMQ